MDIGLQDASQTPALIRNFYLSDHFMWQNNFDKTNSQQFFFRVAWPRYHFSVSGTSTVMGSYVYYDSLAAPAQASDSIRVSQLSVQKDFRLWKIRFNNLVWIQETNSDVVRIPEFISHHSLFYEDRFFKNKLATQIGFDFHYTSEYFSNAYSPAASVFYSQQSVKTNGYLLVDFFVNFKIKTARLFIKLQNAGDNLVKKNYMNTPHYPMPGLVFQFGVNWRFFD